ncbi:MAG: hypothetical protein GY854_01330 [Deltaproteobacteria bacterium]|nr:hypothetical protein [Deltaproteobacteria bacterium]
MNTELPINCDGGPLFDYGPKVFESYSSGANGRFLASRCTYGYDEQGWLENQNCEYFEDDGAFISSFSASYTYGTKGRIDRLYSETFRAAPNSTMSERTDYMYDENERLFQKTTERLDTQWEPWSRTNYVYDSEGRLEQRTNESFENNQWVPEPNGTNILFMYDDRDRVTLEAYLKFEDGEWKVTISSWGSEYSYDDEDRLKDGCNLVSALEEDAECRYSFFYEYDSFNRLEEKRAQRADYSSEWDFSTYNFSIDRLIISMSEEMNTPSGVETNDKGEQRIFYTSEGSSHTFEQEPGPFWWILSSYGRGDIRNPQYCL